LKARRAENRNGGHEPAKDGPSRRLQDTCIELRLYTTGVTPLSSRAISNLRRLCEAHLDGKYVLEIIDIVKHPEVLKRDQVVAAPTLIKRHPLPIRRFIGDMSATEIILKGLDVAPRDPGNGTPA
jgi:circadian clock protein KaiB